MSNIKSLTIIGASSNKDKYGYKVLRKALEEGIEVYAVNPNKKPIEVELQNQETRTINPYNTLRETPRTTDFVALYIPRKKILESNLVNEIKQKGFPNIIIPPPDNGLDPDSSNQLRKYFKAKGFSDSQLLIDVCYIRDKI